MSCPGRSRHQPAGRYRRKFRKEVSDEGAPSESSDGAGPDAGGACAGGARTYYPQDSSKKPWSRPVRVGVLVRRGCGGCPYVLRQAAAGALIS
ncbi:hypothetical protein ACFFX0_30910 [Citricoccus parietis]|uniref:Uncharacterized protein n=1 Tax=Citricoccus parietis TaxID=592307 RepID=A0ABV5G8T9_9MICC